MSNKEYMIPIFLINGQLESGKTTFLSEIISMGQFDEAKKKLLIVCEEGEVEYDKALLEEHSVDLVVIESKEDLTKEKLAALNEEYDPWVVIVEYNGVWEPQLLLEVEMPEGWAVYQSITIMNAATFQLQWKNMQGIMAEAVKASETVIFNRCNTEMDLAAFRRSMKALNDTVEVVFEDENRRIIQGINSVLPYDLSEDEITIEDSDFGIWFIDVRERQKEYKGKTFTFTAQVLKNPQMGADEFVATRQAMTCCENDIALIGYLCEYDKSSQLNDKDWVKVKAKVTYKATPAYNGEEGPVLEIISIEKGQVPTQEVVSF